MTATVSTVPFNKLVATDAINARSATKDGVDELAASIAAKGLIQPLAVRPADGDKYEIIDGRRRHTALAKLVKSKTLSKTHDVPVIIRHDDDSEALETSLMANTVRLPMHPVDQHEVFVRLSEQGKSEGEIAASFGISEKTVRQHKALGNLAPVVREAWRKGKIDPACAKAFALHPDHAVQTATYEKMKKWPPTESHVRNELTRARRSTAGIHADIIARYTAAGGKISEDLFDETKYLEDPALLTTVTTAWADDHCAATVAKLLAEGWSWVERAAKLPDGWRWKWKTLDDEIDADDRDAENRCDGMRPDEADEHAAKFTAEEKARTGVVLEMFDDGELVFNFGVIKPTEGADADESDEDDEFDDGAPNVDDGNSPGEDTDVAGGDEDDEEKSEANPFAVSDALTQTITEALTKAAAEALKTDPVLAMHAITAALTCRHMAPVNVTNNGHAVARLPANGDFAKLLRTASADGTPPEIAFAAAVASTLDLTFKTWVYKGLDTGIEALRNALPAQAYLDAARTHFNATDYFKRATKDTAIAALHEIAALGHYPALSPELPNALKAHLAQMASERAIATGWLPPELRHPAYTIAAPAQKDAAA